MNDPCQTELAAGSPLHTPKEASPPYDVYGDEEAPVSCGRLYIPRNPIAHHHDVALCDWLEVTLSTQPNLTRVSRLHWCHLNRIPQDLSWRTHGSILQGQACHVAPIHELTTTI